MIDALQNTNVEGFDNLFAITEWVDFPNFRLKELKEEIQKSSIRQEVQNKIARSRLQVVGVSFNF